MTNLAAPPTGPLRAHAKLAILVALLAAGWFVARAFHLRIPGSTWVGQSLNVAQLLMAIVTCAMARPRARVAWLLPVAVVALTVGHPVFRTTVELPGREPFNELSPAFYWLAAGLCVWLVALALRARTSVDSAGR